MYVDLVALSGDGTVTDELSIGADAITAEVAG
jgi:hypothetical protein